jgi:hypothetical protein
VIYRHRQLHLWITDHDYLLLRGLAEERKETLSAVIRNLIKLHQPEPGFAEATAVEASAFFPPPLS